jgi:hypothetical protein
MWAQAMGIEAELQPPLALYSMLYALYETYPGRTSLTNIDCIQYTQDALLLETSFETPPY